MNMQRVGVQYYMRTYFFGVSESIDGESIYECNDLHQSGSTFSNL
jgi:hypothetical protein